jgi:HSP20 family protein
MAFDPDPFQAVLRLQDQLASLLGASTERRSFWGPPSGVFPPINIFRTQDALVIRAELPDVRPEDVLLTIEGRQLTISGERRPPEGGRTGYHRRERPWGQFSRTVHLPDDLDLERVEAKSRNGVLIVTVGVAAAAKPRQINVQAA